MKIYYFYHSDFLPDRHEYCCSHIHSFSEYYDIDYEYIDVKHMTPHIWKQYMEQYGVLTPPMICINDAVVLRHIPYRFYDAFIPDVHACTFQKNPIVLY